MRTFRIASLAIAAAAALTSTLGIAQAVPTRFTHDGRTYEYTAEKVKSRTIIAGRTYPHGERFRLIVRANKVLGVVDGRPVAFRIPPPKGYASLAAAD